MARGVVAAALAVVASAPSCRPAGRSHFPGSAHTFAEEVKHVPPCQRPVGGSLAIDSDALHVTAPGAIVELKRHPEQVSSDAPPCPGGSRLQRCRVDTSGAFQLGPVEPGRYSLDIWQGASGQEYCFEVSADARVKWLAPITLWNE